MGMISAVNPDTGAVEEVSQKAFDLILQEKGWQLADSNKPDQSAKPDTGRQLGSGKSKTADDKTE